MPFHCRNVVNMRLCFFGFVAGLFLSFIFFNRHSTVFSRNHQQKLYNFSSIAKIQNANTQAPTPTGASSPPPPQQKEIQAFLHNIKTIALTPPQKAVYIETIRLFDRLWRQTHKKPYFLYGGTLLGAYRHSGIVPWDDDFDIVINYDDVPFLLKLRNTSKIFSVVPRAKKDDSLYKLFMRDPNKTKSVKQWRWPFIDVWRYQVRGNIVRIQDNTVTYKFERNDVFPLIEMPFEEWILPVPRCPLTILKKVIGPGWNFKEQCYAPWYSHQLEAGRAGGKRQIACKLLKQKFSFTKWRRTNKTHVQELIEPPNGPARSGHIVHMPERKPGDCL